MGWKNWQILHRSCRLILHLLNLPSWVRWLFFLHHVLQLLHISLVDPLSGFRFPVASTRWEPCYHSWFLLVLLIVLIAYSINRVYCFDWSLLLLFPLYSEFRVNSNSYFKSNYDIIIFTKHKGLSRIRPRDIDAFAQGIITHSLIRDSIPHGTHHVTQQKRQIPTSWSWLDKRKKGKFTNKSWRLNCKGTAFITKGRWNERTISAHRSIQWGFNLRQAKNPRFGSSKKNL